jgi:transposase
LTPHTSQGHPIMTRNLVFVGIDVSKSSLSVFVEGGDRALQVANDPSGWDQLIATLAGRKIAAIGLEPTGGYERGVMAALAKAGLTVRRVDAWRVRRFAGAMARHGKSDRVDAVTITAFLRATAADPPTLPADPAGERLSRLNRLRARIVALRVALDNHLELADRETAALAQPLFDQLEALKAKIAERCDQVIAGDARLARRAEIIQSVPGIGPITTCALLADLPELGEADPKKVCALAGVAPYDKQSGRRRGKARISRGRARVRRPLFMAGRRAIQFNPRYKAFAARLIANGKAYKVIVVAVMRKILLTLNTMLRKNQTWKPLPV